MRGQQITLGIETSNPSAGGGGEGGGRAGVALARIESGSIVEVLATEMIPEGRRHDDQLMPAIDRLARAAGVQPGDIRCVAVSIGPGGFTALRIATATAKMLAFATGARCVGVPSGSVVARRVQQAGPFAVALASKNDRAFVTIFEDPDHPRGPGELMDANRIQRLDVSMLVADQFLPAPLAQAALSRSIHLQPPTFDPVACIEASVRLDPIDPPDLAPLYGREPEAVTKWRRLRAERDR